MARTDTTDAISPTAYPPATTHCPRPRARFSRRGGGARANRSSQNKRRHYFVPLLHRVYGVRRGVGRPSGGGGGGHAFVSRSCKALSGGGGCFYEYCMKECCEQTAVEHQRTAFDKWLKVSLSVLGAEAVRSRGEGVGGVSVRRAYADRINASRTR